MTGFLGLFPRRKPIIGMLHLAGRDSVGQALEELAVYEDEGVDGAIVENYHGDIADVERALEAIAARGTPLRIGVNILPNAFPIAFDFACTYGASFIQADYVAGRYTRGRLPVGSYDDHRDAFPSVLVMGGVWPKYYTPVPGSDLESDIRTGMRRADAIAVTGEGTGKETPLAKLREFRRIAGLEYPLFTAAGLTAANAAEQLAIVDGAVVGSAFKPDGDTQRPVRADLVRAVMRAVPR